MKKSIVTVLVLIGLLSLVLVGCGNSVKNTDEKKGKELIMEQIKKRGKIVVGTEAAFAPFEFVEDGKIVGYGADVLHEIVKNLGVEMEQLDVPFSGILPGLEGKQFDFVATALVSTPERKEKFGLTVPIADFGQVFVKLKSNDEIKTLDDIDGKIVGCPTGSMTVKELEDYSKKLKAEGKKGIIVKTYQSNTETFVDLKNGRIDLLLPVLAMANVIIRDEPDTYEIIGEFGMKSYTVWATRKEDKDLLEFLNTEILKLKKSGKLAELQQKWFGTTWDLPDTLPN